MFRETQLAVCPSSAVMEYAEAFFTASDDAGRAGAFSATPHDETPSCRVVLDPTDAKRWRKALELAWCRNSSFLLPNFNGSLRVRPMFVNSELTLEGRYAWQSLRPDASLDPIALAIGRAAMRSLLQQIVSRCEAEWVTFANGCPSMATCNERGAAVRSASSTS